ncbi:YdiU family protein [Cellulophaga sp. 20_2_10]|uniref:protein adenylyltransferase SelO n=1 Tax=Cellulophaga sp. 20_2_10 TaxID=2942476 RepID=UPI00201AC0CA|nr:YdiU family protein [Cellulophaga sp. 20_2_10]MCL5244229.1 YdiU family protein [Cellulophaga sp. 20_2_10]
MKFNLKDRFTSQLPADPILENSRRQVSNACFSYVTPKQTANPQLLHVSDDMLQTLGLTKKDSATKEFLNVFTGNSVMVDTKPYAMCYGGHQFGNWAGQLGDGRAINLAEVEHNNKIWALQLKGAGETPYSRTADGLAVLRSSVREYLCSEAMYHLGVPTTRALSLALTGDQVLRDMLYNGNAAYEKGAVVSRVAPSFLRFGSFQLLAAREDTATLKTLVDYTIKNHFSHLGDPSKETYIAFFKEVAERTLEMIVHWQRVGFVHGVMNTDNMSILGLTIDYGPYGWLEDYDVDWTPNTTDAENRRYRYSNQPNVGLWNLFQLANALFPLVNEAAPLEAILDDYKLGYDKASLKMMRSKIGLYTEFDSDFKLIQELEANLQLVETDMTIFYRTLANFNNKAPEEALKLLEDAYYNPDALTNAVKSKWNKWFTAYANRLELEHTAPEKRKQQMNLVNPKYVLRNYMSQLAIDAAENGDYTLINELYTILKQPYNEQQNHNKWFAKRPEWARHKVGCSMLSCSS